MTNKEKYREFCRLKPDIPIFSKDWWLDAVAGNEWDVVLVERPGGIVASFPFVKKQKFGFQRIAMPILSQKLGPYIVYDNKITYTTKIGYEHDIYEEIIKSLPKYDDFCINFDQNYKNWLPFYWNGFSQTTRYSYRIYNIKDYEAVFSSFIGRKKAKIRKNFNNLFMKTDLPVDEFYDYYSKVISDDGGSIGYDKALFIRLCNAIYLNNAGKIFYCVDSKKNICEVKLVIWDSTVAYALTGGGLKEYRVLGANDFLVNEIIKYVAQFVDIFDFEGSMIQGVERSYRNFGGQQTEYYSISKINSRLLKAYKALF